MRLAVAGWATDSGIGRELIDAVRNLPVGSAYILPSPNKPSRADLLSRIPVYQANGQSPHAEMHGFLREHRPDVVLTWELPGDWMFPTMWKSAGIHWVHVVHWDYFDPKYKDYLKLATLVSPNRFCKLHLEEVGLKSTLLPVPVDTERIRFTERKNALRFLSVYGYGGPEQRRSLGEILKAWKTMNTPPELVIRAQCDPFPPGESAYPPMSKIEIGNLPEPADLFTGFDIALQPSRYEGIGVTMLEAQASGMPVIAMDGPPMNEIAPDLPIQIQEIRRVQLSGKEITTYVPSVEKIKKTVGGVMGRDIRDLSKQARRRVEESYSWKALKDKWLRTLVGMPLRG